MKDYEYINQNGDYIDCWILVEDNKELYRENQQLREQIKDIDFWNKEYTEEFYKNKLLKKQVIDVINILQIGIDIYNNNGSGSALFKVICEAKRLLKILEDKEV